ncbi:MAG: excinuclease ABC subunit UvrA [Mariniblastus sp.]|nr:excinuclease ABC subunit UvrA [Mariniblastus sp.]
MPASDITIKGAREHNLRDVDLILPRNQLICLTGVSGSGKSSLAFDTVFAEGQRRYVESLSSFARQFLGQMPKPDVDLISGLSPSISISQKSSGNNPRSTVGTMTEIYDFLRVLYARAGQGFCPKCDQPISAQTRDQIIGSILLLPKGTHYAVLAPVVRAQKGEHRDLFIELLKQGFSRVRVNGEVRSLADDIQLDRQRRHDIEVVIDRLVAKTGIRARLSEAVELGLKIGKRTIVIAVEEETPPEEAGPSRSRRQPGSPDRLYSADYACANCGVSFTPPTPQMFSFNSPQGMCDGCDGLGDVYSFDPELLIPDPGKSFQQGCIELVGKWKDLGRWRRHIYKGVASTVERLQELPEGTMLETAWEELPEELQTLWLYGTGDLHITYTWRGGNSPMKYGGTFDGVIPELDEKYRTAKSAPKIRQLEQYMNEMDCSACHGERLNEQARHFRIETRSPAFKDAPSLSLPDICQLSIADAHAFFTELELDKTRTLVAEEPVKEIRNRLGFLLNVGLDYLTLDRTAPTLSGGESQRIRLAGQIGAGLVGVLYILDEPSIGLHPRDNDRLIATLKHLRDLGNTVVVVEHDEDTMRAADHLIDFGPGPGVHGGNVVYQGPPQDIATATESVTGEYLTGQKTISTPSQRRTPDPDKMFRILGAEQNNLKGIDVEIPLGMFVCVTGVSGSGKSSLVNDILVETLREKLNHGIGDPGHFRELQGLELMDKMIAIDQSPIGRTPRSNPGTYIKLFDEIRKLYTQLPDAKKRGFKPGRFSFNVKGGRCDACEGNGSNKLEMDFLADVWVTCPVCQGKRFNRETLQVKYRGKSISDVLNMDIAEALDFFENIPKIQAKLQTLRDVGLDYLKIGQPSPTLSGGEAQRIKLARELVKRSTGKTLYLLDEPTTGLHFADIQLLLNVLQGFVDAGNTVLVVEHNLEVIKAADWVIDLGPEGGAGGGQLVAAGPPEKISKTKGSMTGQALARAWGQKPVGKTKRPTRVKRSAKPVQSTEIKVRGAEQHNLKMVDADIARDRMTVFCGPSGSGKSSLAMDTIYAEGQRRYVESLSSYARQFVNQLEKPKVDQIEGLSPAIAIEQKNLGSTPRSTVGTITEVYDYLRILFSRLGTGYCPECAIKIGTQTSDQIVDKIMRHPNGQKLVLLAPLELDASQSYEQLWEEVRSKGFARVRLDGITYPVEEAPTPNRRSRHTVEMVVDRFVVQKKSHGRIADSVETALSLGAGVLSVAIPQDEVPENQWETIRHSQHLACESCGRSFERLSPNNFSFNSRLGWCDDCEGIGTQMGADPKMVIPDPERSLRDGAVGLWPQMNTRLAKRMLEVFCQSTGIPIDTPFNELDARHRRLIYYGTQDRWFDVTDKQQVVFSFQFKGVYPTLEEASRLSPSLRHKMQSLIGEVECGACGGSRLRDDASAVRFRDHVIDGLCRMPFGRLAEEIASWKLDGRESKVAGELLREISSRVEFLNDVGLQYITLARTAGSLSNGEAQRIRLASQLGSGLCGVLYVLDEPTIGLHPRDNTRLLSALHRLRDLGNTLIVVEHDREIIENSDEVFDFGPQAGSGGGQLVAHGSPAQVQKRRASVTGPYLSGKKAIPIPSNRRPALSVEEVPQKPKKKGAKKQAKPAPAPPLPLADTLDILGAHHNNLKEIDVQIPLGTLTVVTGPSGCGKSSLINDVLYNSLAKRLHRASTTPGGHRGIAGIEHINKVIRVDQNPLGNSPTSNPATYTGAFELIRNLFAHLPDAKLRGYTARRFSFNVPGGRCEECCGNGQICIEMHFLPDVWVPCEACHGRRYNDETLAVRYNNRSINDVLEMPCGEAVELFHNIPKIRRILQTLCDVGLGYLTLGQSAPTLSGGEAQRVKLAAELARPDTGRTLYLLDEPTTGLHFDDLAKLLEVLQRLVDLGNSVVLIEHNLDIIKAADWLIDMGPEAGVQGGQVVVQGTPEQVVEYAARAAKPKSKLPPSYTGEALAEVLEAGPYKERPEYDPHKVDRWRKDDIDIEDVGQSTKMPWESDGRRWHTMDRVGRKGEPVNWDGQILERVVDKIQQEDGFAETDWSERTVVEVTGQKKSEGWFFHAITGEAWLLKMKFRVRSRTFKREELLEQIPLRSANEMDELPIYGNTPRVRVLNNKKGFQEIEIRAYSWQEINIPGFWKFLDQAIASFQNRVKRVEMNLDDHTPWAKLGQKWHFMAKGFPTGRKVQWKMEVLEVLRDLLQEVSPEANFLWKNKQVVHFYLPDRKDPWASIQTKKPDALWLQLSGPENSVSLGRVADLADDPSVTSKAGKEVVRINLKHADQLNQPEFKQFLREHHDRTADPADSADSA